MKSFSFILFCLLFAVPGFCQTEDVPVKSFKDIVFLQHGEQSLKLDLYVPEQGEGPFPLVVWIHGGSWLRGSKKSCLPLNMGFCQNGYAVASLSYRFSDVAPFPAQLEDVKAAIRWLRAHSKEYGIDPDRIGVIGRSAGGHLACLLGLTGNTTTFDVGENLDQKSEVQAVCNYFGPTDFSSWMQCLNSGHPSSTRLKKVIHQLLGDDPDKNTAALEKASPTYYIHQDAAPFLHIHGTKDETVPVEQAELLHDRLRQADLPSRIFLMPQAGHGGEVFYTPEITREIILFFDKYLKVKTKSDG